MYSVYSYDTNEMDPYYSKQVVIPRENNANIDKYKQYIEKLIQSNKEYESKLIECNNKIQYFKNKLRKTNNPINLEHFESQNIVKDNNNEKIIMYILIAILAIVTIGVIFK